MATLIVAGVRLSIDNPEHIRAQISSLNRGDEDVAGYRRQAAFELWGTDEAGVRTWVLVTRGTTVLIQE